MNKKRTSGHGKNMEEPILVLVAGAGGFIGGHLVHDLLRQGRRVRAVDIKPLNEWYQVHNNVF